jgi:GNAT superfamily N-acetyltransferase
MSRLASATAETAPTVAERVTWHVRKARGDDITPVAIAIEELLLELGGKPASRAALEEATRELLEDRHAGALLVAQAREGIVGVLGASWQTAIHVPGRYGLIQDLWVHPAWRSRAIGADLLTGLFELAGQQRISRIEVGLPKESFEALAATEAFYRRNGFASLGPRMRWERR